jgi:uncharacterized protein (TIGR02147 family)
MRKRALLDVFRYQNYREFLSDYYRQRKAAKDGFSLRAFSKRVGLRSPNYLKLVMDGDRNLTPEMAIRFAESCGLAKEAVEFFCELVAFNQARSASERELRYNRLKRFPRFRKVHSLSAAQQSYHGHWYFPAIRELVAHAEFRDDPKWIAATLVPSITPQQAKKALEVLVRLGLLVRDPKSGRLDQSDPLVETPEGPLGHQVVQYHRAMMSLAADALDRIPREEREIASLTLCLSESRMLELKSELEQIRSSILQRYESDENADRIVQLNLQMFPLSKKKE